eukprot:TRINITY_DN115360_c0_g1_i1.p1 TRINITY_DN115360_c0_g1~~TRINITY_DN115360_c0_g1_i1.p1  ORF type:complete len:343 (+),score=88.00 TRINITY_DN115360_c0_g1_i1:65-1030(+)
MAEFRGRSGGVALLAGSALLLLLAGTRSVSRDFEHAGRQLRSSSRHIAFVDSAGAGHAGPPECEEVRAEQMKSVHSKISSWQKAADEGRTIAGFGRAASRLLNSTLANFDKQVKAKLDKKAEPCLAERQALQRQLQEQLRSISVAQRSSVEELQHYSLKKRLLKRMRAKGRALDAKEQLQILQASLREYRAQVRDVTPAFAEDVEQADAERRIKETLTSIGETAEAKQLQQRWALQRMRSQQERKFDVSLSLSPGLRVMFRPKGFGNMKMNIKRSVGPMYNPNEVSVSVFNDGNVMDVYNKQAHPPLMKLQPTVGVDLSMG